MNNRSMILTAGILILACHAALATTLLVATSGTDNSPIVYRVRPGEVARIVGGRAVTGWQPVTDPAILKRC